MERLDEEWTPRCVASHFKIDHDAGRPVGCSSSSDFIFSKTCGMGWRFALKYDDEVDPPEVEIYFDPYAADSDLRDIRVAIRHLDEGKISVKARDFDKLPKAHELLSCWQLDDIINHPHICFMVIFPPLKFMSDTEDELLPRKVLGDSMRSGSFVDMRFFAFSKRLAGNSVGRPMPVFANSALLTQTGRTSILGKYFAGGPLESTFMKLGQDKICPEQLMMDEYGYESDSDLEEEYDDTDNSESGETDLYPDTLVGTETHLTDTSNNHANEHTYNKPESINITVNDPEEQFVETDLYSDTPIEENKREDHPVSSTTYDNLENFHESTGPRAYPDAPVKDGGPENHPINTESRRDSMIITKQNILLKDIAYKTWQSLVYHAYTGEVTFSNLKSEPHKDIARITVGEGFQCSPKSMYRLADKLGLEDLRKEAFKAITERITENNILEEVFSRFTSRYPEVLEMEIDALCKYWDSPKVVAGFPKKMARVAAGGLPHSFAVLAKFSPPRRGS